MKTKIAALAFLLALPMTGFGQSTLNYPRLFTESELLNAGFVVVNPGPTTATVIFTLYDAGGTEVSNATQIYAPRTQRARLGNQIFSTLGSGGWVRATSSTTGLQGFWITYDPGLVQYLDGAEATSSYSDQVIPIVAGQTEVNVANPNSSIVTATFRIYGETGLELGILSTQNISPNGLFQGDAAHLFPSANIGNARYIRVTASGGGPLSATAFIRGYLVSQEAAAVNGVSLASTVTEANFPHVISGSLGAAVYTTAVSVTNLSPFPQTVDLTFTPDGGGVPISIQRSLQAGGAVRDTAQNFFNLGPGFQNGWVKVSGTLPLTGVAAYADLASGGLAVVPVQAAPQTALVFAHIANRPPLWQTGIALLNTSTTTANVEIFAMTPAGALIGGASTVSTARFNILPGTKVAKTLSELVPATETRTDIDLDGGFVFMRTTNNVPLYGIELFYTRNGRLLSNVAAAALAPGITYIPPTP